MSPTTKNTQKFFIFQFISILPLVSSSLLEDVTSSFSVDEGRPKITPIIPNVPVTPPTLRATYVENGVVNEVLSEFPGDTLVIPVDKYGLHIAEDIPSKALRLECNASFPVEWVYEGLGSPFNVISKTFRNVGNFSDPKTYTFSTFFYLTRNDERNTGKYICKPAQLNSTANETSFFDIFVPGQNLFLPMKSKTITLSQNDTTFIIPCPVSNSRISNFVKLYQDVGIKPVRVTTPMKYNPRTGFIVEINPSLSILSYKGKYFCKEPMSRKKSAVHTVLPPKESIVQVSPNITYIKIVPGTKQVFVCAAKENVTITFSGDRQPRIIDFELNPDSDYPFVATFEINPANVNITSEHTIINCVNSKDEVLHSWEYSTYDDVSLHKFYFDSQRRYQDARYVCCSDSYYKPRIEYTFCRSETECAMKKLMFDQDESTKDTFLGDHYHRISHLNRSCIAFHPYLKYTLSSGVLRCSVQGMNEEIHRDFMYYFNPHRIYQAYTDEKFDTTKVFSSESIMKLSKTPAKNTLVGETQRFLCYFSELFLANGIVWVAHYLNGTSRVLENSYNYMKSNTSFSQIEITFNDTNVGGITCNAPVKDSPTAWRNITGSVFVRNPPQIRASIQTVSGEVLKEFPVNSSEVILEDSELDILNNSLNANALETFFVLDCNASFPVDFSYFGEGRPNIEYLPNREVNGSVLDANAYHYSAKLRFRQLSYEIVGKYLCVSSSREFGHRNQAENLGANVNVYFPGERLFVSSENQTYRLWGYRDSVLIPCPVADPRPNITLMKYNNETTVFEPLVSPIPIIFNSLYGFSLTKNHTSNLYGLYKCVGDLNRTSGIIQVYAPSDEIRVNPYVKEIQLLANDTQTFVCECKENVTLTFSDDPTSVKGRKISYTENLFSTYPYKASYDVEMGEFKTATIVNCTTVNGSRSMHTWEVYNDDGAFIDTLSFDNSTSEMKCCTKPYRSPSIEWVNCTSVTDCSIKQAACLTQNKCQSGDYVISGITHPENMKDGCLTFNAKERPYGLLKCVVKGIHKIVAQAMVYYYNEDNEYEVHDGYFLGTKMFDKFDVKNDRIMNLTVDSPKPQISIGDKVTFDCKGSKFWVSSTIKWALEAKNGSVYYTPGKDISNYKDIRSRLEVEFESDAWKTVYCIAPNWKEYFGWRNVSLPLAFENINEIDTATGTTPNSENIII